MRIFHIATVADWEAVQVSGSYTTSTYGVTLAEEGFVHASRADQWEGVLAAFYGEVTEPLVLLELDTDLLQAEVRVEDGFPHLYGPLEPAAVVAVTPITGR